MTRPRRCRSRQPAKETRSKDDAVDWNQLTLPLELHRRGRREPPRRREGLAHLFGGENLSCLRRPTETVRRGDCINHHGEIETAPPADVATERPAAIDGGNTL